MSEMDENMLSLRGRLDTCEHLYMKYSEKRKILENLNIKFKSNLSLKEKLLQDRETLEHEKKNLQKEVDSLCSEIDSTNSQNSSSKDLVQNLLYEKARIEKERSDEKEEAKKKFFALRTAMAYFKRRLRCYIHLESIDDVIFKFYFFKTKDDGDMDKFYVKLQCQKQNWKVFEIKPSLPCEAEISHYLASCGRVPAVLSHVREEFLKKLSP